MHQPNSGKDAHILSINSPIHSALPEIDIPLSRLKLTFISATYVGFVGYIHVDNKCRQLWSYFDVRIKLYIMIELGAQQPIISQK